MTLPGDTRAPRSLPSVDGGYPLRVHRAQQAQCLQQFFKWLVVDEETLHRSPMQRVRQPITPEKLIPILTVEETRKLLGACASKSFVDLRMPLA